MSESSGSVYTTTSSSTQWGPGALAGKAIRAMGKAVVRGAEYVVISRRLSAIKAAFSPRSDDNRPTERMFDDLLELSRLALYPEAFRIEAMTIIIAQIASEDTYHLQCSFSKWEIDREELVTLLSEIIGVVLFWKRGFADARLVDAYMMALPQDRHPWLPCVKFITAIAQLNDSMLHGVMAARFLEMILWVSGSQTLSNNPDHLLLDACSKAFAIMPQPDLYILWSEQIGGPRSRNSVSSLPGVLTCIAVEHLWLVVEARLLEMHAEAMLELMLPHRQLFRIHPRMLSLSYPVNGRPRFPLFYSQTLSARFMRNFLRCIGIGGNMHNKTVNYLSHLTYEKKVIVFTGMIEHLIVQSHVDPSTVESFMILFTPESPDIASNIIQFLIAISNPIESAGSSLLDAALLNTLPFVRNSWDPSRIVEDLYRRMYFPVTRRHQSPPVYRAHTLELLSSIRSLGLSAVVTEAGQKGGWVHFLQPLFN
ncbi:hypothetical protein C8R45DRAFT_1181869 [Mycena sanguinolenta]|nr:hypothetical protein C8R45DRAFT_1181869 [Mycena sanguinolenta]